MKPNNLLVSQKKTTTFLYEWRTEQIEHMPVNFTSKHLLKYSLYIHSAYSGYGLHGSTVASGDVFVSDMMHATHLRLRV